MTYDFFSNTKNMQIINKVTQRAQNMNLLKFNKTSLAMDLDFWNSKEALNFEKLHSFDDCNFVHDIVGIQNHIDRDNYEIDSTFSPRSSRGSL